jgi:hypothetical protein
VEDEFVQFRSAFDAERRRERDRATAFERDDDLIARLEGQPPLQGRDHLHDPRRQGRDGVDAARCGARLAGSRCGRAI